VLLQHRPFCETETGDRSWVIVIFKHDIWHCIPIKNGMVCNYVTMLVVYLKLTIIPVGWFLLALRKDTMVCPDLELMMMKMAMTMTVTCGMVNCSLGLGMLYVMYTPHEP
jgi:hypothetical protein